MTRRPRRWRVNRSSAAGLPWGASARGNGTRWAASRRAVSEALPRTAIHLTIPTGNPWVPLRILTLGRERNTTYRVVTSQPLEFACHLPGHYAYGMHGVVRVRGATS